MITVIDLHIGNIASVSRALKYLNAAHAVSDDLDIVKSADRLILPGVGSFSEASRRLKSTGLYAVIKNRVLARKIPILGICLGMQLFADYGDEGGRSDGLGFIGGSVRCHRAALSGFRLPHIGWNDVRYDDFKIFDAIPDNACFYFAHSYELIPAGEVKSAYSNYGVDFVAAVQKDNIVGCQFHPEKSQKAGLKLLENFCRGVM